MTGIHISACISGVSGKVIIDQYGDRTSALQFKNLQNGNYRRVFNFYSIEKRLELLNETEIVWPGNVTTAPIGRPKCGFNGEFCVVKDESKSKGSFLHNSLSI